MTTALFTLGILALALYALRAALDGLGTSRHRAANQKRAARNSDKMDAKEL